jgi:membrane protein DedA with SNARE-associated domain/rhodanese-related sulfurtransferase
LPFNLQSAIAANGFSIIAAVVFLEAVGLPVPASLALLIGGAAAARNLVDTRWTLLAATVAMMAGDVLLFFLGRYTGWKMLGFLCHVSLNPESCILRSAEAFYRRGKTVLVIAKFLPGINTMAPPLAGSMNMGFWQFFGLDLAASLLYIGVCFGAGYLFSDLLEVITHGYELFGNAMGSVLLAAALAYAAYLLWRWWQARLLREVPRVRPNEAAADETGALFDVRSHGYYDSGAQRAAGSQRLEPNGLHLEYDKLPKDKRLYLYCTCAGDATAIRVGRMLLDQGLDVRVIEGGMGAWTKAGLALETVPPEDTVALPRFR